ncbi:hypothetical protein BT67DRAFT_300605 [Trichocladium antarcticum]|uniref:Uncharacterized protein n=1 Tax=Trichocladium antarcticum TaxID=1450529 RepID=A0AAN6UL06_9PEZI|nr:hypothetical protein BT67DRAFT_300605 [Trichocladium antarcticum]
MVIRGHSQPYASPQIQTHGIRPPVCTRDALEKAMGVTGRSRGVGTAFYLLSWAFDIVQNRRRNHDAGPFLDPQSVCRRTIEFSPYLRP